MATPTYLTYGIYLVTDDAGDLGTGTISYPFFKKWILLCSLFIFVFLIFVSGSSDSKTIDPRFPLSPVLEGVDRVYILVEYSKSGVKDEEIPESLLKENIKKTILNAYTRRFSSTECLQFYSDKPKQGFLDECTFNNDQSVELVEPSSEFMFGKGATLKDGRKVTEEELHSKGTLIVLFNVSINGNNWTYDPPLATPYALIQHIQYRPGADYFLNNRIPSADVIQLNQAPERIQELVLWPLVDLLK